jgi:uncharacterized RDD family membrane protein YckC
VTDVEAESRNPYGGFPSRAVAYIADTLIISISTSVGILITSATINALFPTHKDLEISPWLYALILTWVGGFYFVGFWTFTTTTPAMWVLGLRVTRVNGGRVHILRAIVRYLAFGISALFFGLGFLWVLFDRRHQAWHDKIARTVVPYSQTGLGRPGKGNPRRAEPTVR